MPTLERKSIDPESRLKEPLFRGFLVVMIAVMALGLAGSLYNRSYEQLPTVPLTVVVFGAVFFSLHRWGYEAASTPFVYALAGLFLWSIVNRGYDNEQNFLWTASIALILMLVGGLFFNRYRDMLILSAGLWLFFAVHVSWAFWNGRVTTGMLSLDQQLIAPTLLMVVGMVLMLLVRRVFSRIVEEYRTLSEARLRSQESLGQLVRGLAHHLNTPLSNAKLAISLSPGPSEGRRAAETDALLERSIDNSMQLVRRLSDFMRLCDTPPIASTDGLGLQSLVILQSVRAPLWVATEAYTKNLAVPRAYQWETLSSVVAELVGNVWVHGKGQPTVVADWNRGHLVLSIEGPGDPIDTGLRQRVRDPFFSTLVTPEHPGLGLYFSDYLTTFVLKGELAIEDGLQGGTCVRVVVPLS